MCECVWFSLSLNPLLCVCVLVCAVCLWLPAAHTTDAKWLNFGMRRRRRRRRPAAAVVEFASFRSKAGPETAAKVCCQPRRVTAPGRPSPRPENEHKLTTRTSSAKIEKFCARRPRAAAQLGEQTRALGLTFRHRISSTKFSLPFDFGPLPRLPQSSSSPPPLHSLMVLP